MKENTKSILRRTAAAVLALSIVTGAPAQVFHGLISDTAITANAAGEVAVSSFEQLQENVKKDSVIIKLTDNMIPTRNKNFKVTGSDVTLNLNGYKVTGNSQTTSYPVFQVEAGAKLTITDYSSQKLGVITGGMALGAIYVKPGGTLVLEAGTISGNVSKKTNYGGAVTLGTPNNFTGEAKFIMTGGVIENNTAYGETSVSFGGAVLCNDNSVFEMSGGTIRNNEASQKNVRNSNGGAVALRSNSIFKMSGKAVISGNTAKRGSAVGLSAQTATFEMTGGTIKENICSVPTAGNNDSNIGAVSVEAGVCTISGGSIIDNVSKVPSDLRGAGISFGSELNISGDINITGNYMLIGNSTEKKYSNIRVGDGQVINIAGQLADTAKVGVSVFGDQIITKGWGCMGGKSPKSYFTVDDLLNDTYYATLAASGEVRITKESGDVEQKEMKFTVNENGSAYSNSKVTVKTTVDGSVLSSNVGAKVIVGKTVTLDVQPKDGVKVESVTYKYGNNEKTLTKNINGVYTFIMPNSDVTVNVNTSEDSVTLKGRNISLEGDISLNYTLSVPASAKSTAEMQFTADFGNGKETIKVKGTANSDGTMVYKCPITAKNMTTEVSAKLVNGTKTLWPSGDSDVYSVRGYAKDYFDNIDLIDSGRKYEKLIKSMLNYGAYSQLYFNYKTDDLANSILSAKDKDVTDLKTYGSKFKTSTLPSGVLTGSNLTLSDKIAVSIIFKDADKVEFVDSDKSVTVTYGNTSYGPKLMISDILALNVSKNYKIKVTKDSTTKTIEYGPSFYCHNVIDLNKGKDEQLRLLIQALCKFSNAAEAIS
ncbi:MAG: hypothetical protein K6B74_01560 [Ruminococcus sp.]|nr:hypothetical protein [Ruminococcus sp.]